MDPGLGTDWSNQDYCGHLAAGAGTWGQGAVCCCGLLLHWAHILKLKSILSVEGFRERHAQRTAVFVFFFLTFCFVLGYS